jgi:hypothetical protein
LSLDSYLLISFWRSTLFSVWSRNPVISSYHPLLPHWLDNQSRLIQNLDVQGFFGCP